MQRSEFHPPCTLFAVVIASNEPLFDDYIREFLVREFLAVDLDINDTPAAIDFLRRLFPRGPFLGLGCLTVRQRGSKGNKDRRYQSTHGMPSGLAKVIVPLTQAKRPTGTSRTQS
jgi:hypothetical protein